MPYRLSGNDDDDEDNDDHGANNLILIEHNGASIFRNLQPKKSRENVRGSVDCKSIFKACFQISNAVLSQISTKVDRKGLCDEITEIEREY